MATIDYPRCPECGGRWPCRDCCPGESVGVIPVHVLPPRVRIADVPEMPSDEPAIILAPSATDALARVVAIGNGMPPRHRSDLVASLAIRNRRLAESLHDCKLERDAALESLRLVQEELAQARGEVERTLQRIRTTPARQQ